MNDQDKADIAELTAMIDEQEAERRRGKILTPAEAKELLNIAQTAKGIEAIICSLQPPTHSMMCDLLTGMVEERKAEEAKEINDAGIPAQLAYLADIIPNAKAVALDLAFELDD